MGEEEWVCKGWKSGCYRRRDGRRAFSLEAVEEVRGIRSEKKIEGQTRGMWEHIIIELLLIFVKKLKTDV